MELNELDFENMGNWPLAIKAVFILLCCTILFILSYWFFIKPQWNALKQVKLEQANLLQAYRTKHRDAINLIQYQEQLKKIQLLLTDMLAQLPNSSDIPNLVEDISKLGTLNGLDFQLIKPDNEIQEDFVTVMPINMIVNGRYHQLAGFISDVSRLQRIVVFDDFTIRRQEETPDRLQKVTADTKLTMNIIAKTFRYKTELSVGAKP